MPRRTLVLGGARSGKSVEAERRLESFPDVLYVATGGSPGRGQRVGGAGRRAPGAAAGVLADRRDLRPGAAAGGGRAAAADRLSVAVADGRDGLRWGRGTTRVGGRRASEALRERVAELTGAVRATRRTVVAVSNEVGSGIVPATASGRRYRDELGRLNAAFAGECEQVLLVVAGQALVLRG